MRKRKIGAVVFPGFEMLDFYGPLEMFAMFPDAFEIAVAAETPAPVEASGGPATLPQVTFADPIEYDILLVPGGLGTRAEINNPVMINWLSQAVETAEIVSSVCTGSALLAATGCLDGRKATTNKRAFGWVASTRLAVDWQRSARWVEAGKVFTSSGVSAGTDMALALIARTLGDEAAEDASRWAEYIWHRDPDDDPFATDKG